MRVNDRWRNGEADDVCSLATPSPSQLMLVAWVSLAAPLNVRFRAIADISKQRSAW